MAGIIAGHGHGAGNGDGVMGIAPEAKILPVRVILEDGDPARAKARSTRGNALAEGIRWAADHGADVINLSLGDDSESAHPEPAEDEAVQYALAQGRPSSSPRPATAARRATTSPTRPPTRASSPSTAVDRYGTRAAFSTRRWYATVSAPGVDVVIADPDRKYYEGWGTSAAAAFVSGAVALVKAAHPGLTPAQIKKLLEDTARNAPAGGRDDSRGYGFVDPAAAIEAAARLQARGPEARRPTASEYFGPGPDTADDRTDCRRTGGRLRPPGRPLACGAAAGAETLLARTATPSVPAGAADRASRPDAAHRLRPAGPPPAPPSLARSERCPDSSPSSRCPFGRATAHVGRPAARGRSGPRP